MLSNQYNQLSSSENKTSQMSGFDNNKKKTTTRQLSSFKHTTRNSICGFRQKKEGHLIANPKQSSNQGPVVLNDQSPVRKLHNSRLEKKFHAGLVILNALTRAGR